MKSAIFSLDELKHRLFPVFSRNSVREAILFGSYSKGTPASTSDVDLLVDCDLHGLRFVGLIEDLREALDGKELDVFDKTHIDPKSKIANEIKNTGIKIYAR